MLTENLTYQRADRLVGEENFFPIHLTNAELQRIIDELLEGLTSRDYGLLKVYVRKDKGGKGIDLKLEKTDKTPHQIRKDRLYSLGINANWKLVDFFDHSTTAVGAKLKKVGGKEYYYPGLIANEMMGLELEVPDSIYRRRLTNPQPLVRNPLFAHDEWSCVYEQNNILSFE
jgi:hypothetical protein